MCGKQDGSLILAVGVNEANNEGGGQKFAIQQDSEHVGQLYTEAVVVEKQKKEPVDTGEQVTQDSEPEETRDETELAEEELPVECILLCIEGVFQWVSYQVPYRQWCYRLFCEHYFC